MVGSVIPRLCGQRLERKSYVNKRRKHLEFSVGDYVLLKVSHWKGVVCFGKKGKLAPRFVGPFEIVEKVGHVAYRLRLPKELNGVHDTFHVSNFKKCLADPTLQVPLDEIQVDAKLNFVEEPVEILEREFKKLKRSRIAIVKVRCGKTFGVATLRAVIHAGDKTSGDARSWYMINGVEIKSLLKVTAAKAIMRNLPANDIIESCSVAGPGYVNVILSKQWMAQSIHTMLIDGIDTWAPKLPVKRAIVDFSSPNIAKEMHVGHLRSTIIGDTLACMLEFSKVEVLRRNHVGDWGTQFGMLIEYLFEHFPNGEVNDQAIGELEGGDERYLKAWAQICEISRKGFEQVYERLDVHLEEKVLFQNHVPF
ncbi:arginine--tRNA ligase, chloroplastic/mitochondrial-like protein isoform X2 [Tanacetum coccineum]